ncbi:MAG: cytochrome c [Deltaproteobacteria bacterium]|nr:cytochrome c [Deltaproteobacteria bacterium]
MSLSWVGGAFAACGLIGFGCAATQLGATPAEIAQARSQSEQGARVFASQCAKCHGERGEGVGSAPAILGPGALPEYPRDSGSGSGPLTDPQLLQIEAQARPAGAAWRDPFRNAQDLYDFTRTHAAGKRAGDLSPADTWALVSFILAAQGASLPSGGVGPANATSMKIPRR